MAISWSGPSPKNDCYVGIEFVGVESGNVTAIIYLQCAHYFYDNTNTVTVSGSMSWSGSRSINISASQRNTPVEILRLSGSWSPQYGSPTNGSISVSLTGIEYTGNMAHSASFSIPARPYQRPWSVTDLSATYQNDNAVTVSWTPRATGWDGAVPVTKFYVYRTVDGAKSWQFATELPWGVTSWSDNPGANAVRAYAVTQVGPGGESEWTYSNWIFTSPTPPSDVTAVKASNNRDIVVSWRSNAYEQTANTTHEIYEGSTLVASVPWNQTSYTVSQPSTTSSHTYKVRTVTAGLASAFVAAPTVYLAAAPYAPSSLYPNGQYQRRGSYVTVSWQHNPADGTSQTAFEVSYSTDNGSTWKTTGKRSSSTSSYSWTMSQAQYQWRVRTWGADANKAGAWSQTAIVPTEATPSTSILSPASSAVIGQSSMSVKVSASLSTAKQAQVQILDGSTVIADKTVVGSTPYTLSFDGLANGKTYTIKARTGINAWGLWTSRTVSVSYTPPAEPVFMDATWIPSFGAAYARVVPGEDASAPATVSITVQRQNLDGTWEMVTTDAIGAFTDKLAPIGEAVTYRAVARSADGVERVGQPFQIRLPYSARHAWLNAESAAGSSAIPLANDLDVKDSSGLVYQQLHYFDTGTNLPTLVEGREKTRVLQVSFRLVEADQQEVARELRSLASAPGVKVLRLVDQAPVTGMVSGVSVDRPIGGKVLSCAFTFTEVSA